MTWMDRDKDPTMTMAEPLAQRGVLSIGFPLILGFDRPSPQDQTVSRPNSRRRLSMGRQESPSPRISVAMSHMADRSRHVVINDADKADDHDTETEPVRRRPRPHAGLARFWKRDSQERVGGQPDESGGDTRLPDQ